MKDTEAELLDFKQNKTLEAYFARFKYIPNPEDRKRLLLQIEEFLSEDSTFKHATQSYASDTATEVVSLLGDASLSLVEAKIPDLISIREDDQQR